LSRSCRACRRRLGAGTKTVSDDTTHVLGGTQGEALETLKDRKASYKFNAPGGEALRFGGEALRFRRTSSSTQTNNLHVLSLKTSCMFDGTKTTSSSHQTLAATSSCRHSLSRPHPPRTSSAIITSACSSSHDTPDAAPRRACIPLANAATFCCCTRK